MYRKSEISFTLIRKKKTCFLGGRRMGENAPTRLEKSASSHFSIWRSFGYEFVVKIQRLQCTYLQIRLMKVRKVFITKVNVSLRSSDLLLGTGQYHRVGHTSIHLQPVSRIRNTTIRKFNTYLSVYSGILFLKRIYYRLPFCQRSAAQNCFLMATKISR
jgi:hypothetical protein